MFETSADVLKPNILPNPCYDYWVDAIYLNNW